MWGRPRGTFERFVRETEVENFDPSLWFLAMAGDETVASPSARRWPGGWINVVGVRRPWRKRGLGLALLRHASPNTNVEASIRSPQRGRRKHHRRPQTLRTRRDARQGELRHPPQELRPGVDLGMRLDED